MDAVDTRYRDDIIRALSSGNVDAIMEKVPSLSYDEAESYVEKYQQLNDDTMAKIRASMDTTYESEQQWEIINSLLDKANLSGYSRK